MKHTFHWLHPHLTAIFCQTWGVLEKPSTNWESTEHIFSDIHIVYVYNMKAISQYFLFVLTMIENLVWCKKQTRNIGSIALVWPNAKYKCNFATKCTQANKHRSKSKVQDLHYVLHFVKVKQQTQLLNIVYTMYI